MKKPVRIILWILCALLIVTAPFTLSSPNMLGEVKSMMTENMEEGTEGEEWEEETGLLRFLISSAAAEETPATETAEEAATLSESTPRAMGMIT